MNAKTESWIRSKWRPAMGWAYIAICLFDFIIGPVFWISYQGWFGVALLTQWSPLTLVGGGIFHGAMGAILGVAAWSRGQEKIHGVAGDRPPADAALEVEGEDG